MEVEYKANLEEEGKMVCGDGGVTAGWAKKKKRPGRWWWRSTMVRSWRYKVAGLFLFSPMEWRGRWGEWWVEVMVAWWRSLAGDGGGMEVAGERVKVRWGTEKWRIEGVNACWSSPRCCLFYFITLQLLGFSSIQQQGLGSPGYSWCRVLIFQSPSSPRGALCIFSRFCRVFRFSPLLCVFFLSAGVGSAI